MKDPRWCYYNPNESHNINVKSIKNILIQLKLYNIKPVFISTDAVYDGYGSNYSEDDKPNPIMLYGKQKIIIEEYIKNNFDDYIIFRLAKTYSIDLDDKNILFPKWLTNYSNNNQIICAQDCVISPICVNDVADVIYQSIHKNINGVYNLGGDISYSLYELNKIFYSIFVKFYNNKIKITPIKFNEYDNCDELWPLNCSMENEKLNNVLNLNFKSVEKRINTMLNQYLLTGGNL